MAERKTGKGEALTSFFSILCGAMIVFFSAQSLVPAVRANLGSGTSGTFRIESQGESSRRNTTWSGTFSGDDGTTLHHVEYKGDVPDDVGIGTVIPALYTGSNDYVYDPGSFSWVENALYLLFGLSVIIIVFPKARRSVPRKLGGTKSRTASEAAE
ncbi:hypothetical protein ABGB12_29820 [Actinocorallia sp. B10E7]|uniref:hypothetical protein n=1 Tax=Actinocorallia sp. B10E7 TaxID=3153558 RepID=UPI00325F8E42